MTCNITDVAFGYRSEQGFKNINIFYKQSTYLGTAMSGGVIAQLFFNNAPLAAAYSITQHDFKLFANSMAAIPKIVTRVISVEAAIIVTHSALSEKERTFWSCIYNAH